MKLPWENITKALDPQISEGAITQHLAKMRTKLAAQGVPVPPPLRRGGTAASSAADTTQTTPPSLKSTSKRKPRSGTKSTPAAQMGKGDRGVDKLDGDDDYDPCATKARKLPSRRGRANPKVIKTESDAEDEDKSAGDKRKRGGHGTSAPGSASINKSRSPTTSEGNDAESNASSDNQSERVAMNASYLKFAESDQESDGESDMASEEADGLVALSIGPDYSSEAFPLGLGHWPAGENMGIGSMGNDEYDSNEETAEINNDLTAGTQDLSLPIEGDRPTTRGLLPSTMSTIPEPVDLSLNRELIPSTMGNNVTEDTLTTTQDLGPFTVDQINNADPEFLAHDFGPAMRRVGLWPSSISGVGGILAEDWIPDINAMPDFSDINVPGVGPQTLVATHDALNWSFPQDLPHGLPDALDTTMTSGNELQVATNETGLTGHFLNSFPAMELGEAEYGNDVLDPAFLPSEAFDGFDGFDDPLDGGASDGRQET